MPEEDLPLRDLLLTVEEKTMSEELVFFLVGTPIALIAAAIYMVPAIFAFKKSHPKKWQIFWLNAVTGWTGWGWVGALIWVCIPVEMETITIKKRDI